jgi:L-type amino acid transporter 9
MFTNFTTRNTCSHDV